MFLNTHHIVQADAPAFEQNLTREAIDECKPDLRKTKKMSQNSNIRTEEIQSEIYNTIFFKKPSTLVANNEVEVL